MKIQTASIIYILIIVPILFVMSIALSLRQDTYKSMLNYERIQVEATKDAIQAFEMNTSGEDSKKVSDVLRSIAEASINVYKDSLATKLGMSNISKKFIDSYVPTVAFTLYDGFYISTPSKKPIVATDDRGNAINVDGDSEKEEMQNSENGYKPLLFEKSGGRTEDVYSADTEYAHQMYPLQLYTARADLGGSNYANINFSLDNFLVINGKKDGITFNKSGYLLNKDVNVTLSTTSKNLSLLTNNDTGSEKLVNAYVDEARKNGERIEVTVSNEVIPRYSRTGQTYGNIVKDEELAVPTFKIVYDPADDFDFQGVQDPEKSKKPGDTKKTEYYTRINDYRAKRAYADQQINAIKYYLNAIRFSNWIYANLSNVKVGDIKMDSDYYAEKVEYSAVKNTKIDIFGNDEAKLIANDKLFGGKITDELSVFNIQRKRTIVNAIQYNLLVSARHYDNLKYYGKRVYKRPIITDQAQWDTVANNISMITFFEGVDNLPLGTPHTSFSIVSSTDNDYNITENTMVFVPKNGFNKGDDDSVSDEDKKYYSIDADMFKDEGKVQSKKLIGRKITDFKYDGKINKILRKPIYAFKNFADVSINMPAGEVKKDGTHMFNDIQKKILMTAIAGQKQAQLKLSKYVDDATFEFNPKTDVLQPGSSKNYSIEKISNIIGGANYGIKTVTFTFEITKKDNKTNDELAIYKHKEKYIADIKIKIGNEEYTYKSVAQAGDALSTISIKNGLERKEGIVNYIPYQNVKNAQISYTIKDTKGRQVPASAGVRMEIKEVTFETY